MNDTRPAMMAGVAIAASKIAKDFQAPTAARQFCVCPSTQTNGTKVQPRMTRNRMSQRGMYAEEV